MALGNDIKLETTGGPATLWFTASSIPTSGEHGTDEVCWCVPPVAGGPVGWMCTLEGTPGTWTPFGTVPLVASSSITVSAVANGAQSTTGTVTLTGAALGMIAEGSVSVNQQGLDLLVWVSAANTISYAFSNNTGASVTLGACTLVVQAHS